MGHKRRLRSGLEIIRTNKHGKGECSPCICLNSHQPNAALFLTVIRMTLERHDFRLESHQMPGGILHLRHPPPLQQLVGRPHPGLQTQFVA